MNTAETALPSLFRIADPAAFDKCLALKTFFLSHVSCASGDRHRVKVTNVIWHTAALLYKRSGSIKSYAHRSAGFRPAVLGIFQRSELSKARA